MAIYKVGEFAEKVGVSISTLQRWDRTDVLKSKRTPTNQRYYTDEDLNKVLNLEDETNAIIDIGTLLTYLIDLIFLFKEEKNYMKYLTQRLYYSEIHAKEFIDYEENIIKNLSSK